MDAHSLQWKGNFSGIFPEAKFQFYDLLWRKKKLKHSINISFLPELS